MNDYAECHHIIYGPDARFVPVCEQCGRFVKADETIYCSEGAGLSSEPNATCSKCGRTRMLFEGFVAEEFPGE